MCAQLTFKPRKWQQEFFENKKRFNVLLVHRRAGKTVAAVMHMILEALTTTKTRPQYAYAAPEKAQGEQIVWNYFKEYLQDLPGITIRESKSEIVIGHNQATISIVGLKNIEAIRGRYFDGIIIDEFSDAPATAWGTVIFPALMDRKGWAVIMGTPKGQDHFADMFNRAETSKDEDWYARRLTVYDTQIFSPSDVEKMRDNMTNAQFAQEMLCDSYADFSNKYYLELMSRAEDQGRIGDFIYNTRTPVFTGWDLGRDGTAIWFAQIDKGQINLIDYWEKSNCKLAEAVQVVLNKGYIYKTHFLPHDSGHERINSDSSIYKQIWDLTGSQPLRLERIGISLGISMAQSAMVKCSFDAKKTSQGILSLKNYQAKIDKDRMIMLDTPVHDKFSHGADAFRYLIQGITQRRHIEGTNKALSFSSNFNILNIFGE